MCRCFLVTVETEKYCKDFFLFYVFCVAYCAMTFIYCKYFPFGMPNRKVRIFKIF
uniref:Uncharacterized protein n=1 Tax=Anguilla anguilla TaxID=7936 RepID=A0A0E9XKM1_ANGAN